MADPSLISAVSLPPKDAIAFLRQKVNVPTQRWTDVWNEAHSHAFSVAGAASTALVQDFRDAVAKALEQGTTLAEFRKDFDSIVAKHGWVHNGTPAWRANIIYETNLSTAYSAGRYAQLTEPDVLEAFPYWRYQHNAAIHPRVQHVAWSGLTLRADDGWWSTHFPPNGWRCHCSVSPVSDRGLSRMGKTGPDTAPPLDLHGVRIRDGESWRTVQVPRGIDPSFAYNPGQQWLEHAERPAVGQLPGRPSAPAAPVPRPVRPSSPVHVPATDDEPVLVERGEHQPWHRIPPASGATPPAPIARIAGRQDFSAWSDRVLRDRRPDGSSRVVGQLAPDVMQWLAERNAKPASAELTVTAQQLLHMSRPAKVASGRAIALADLRRLPELLAKPLAVLRDKEDGNLVMVFEPSEPDEARHGRLIVQLGMTIKARAPFGAGRREINGVKSASLVPRQALQNAGRYELVSGAL